MGSARTPGQGMRTIVIGAPHRIGEQRPGLVDMAHPLGGVVGALVEVGVMALREAAMRASHLEGRGIATDAEDRVWIEGAAGGHCAEF